MDERRIGRRVQLGGLTMEVTVPAPARRRFRRPGGPTVHVMDVIDLSVSGALVEGPDTEGLGHGTVVPIRLEGREGLVRIRRVLRDEQAQRSRYGIEFIETDPELRLQIDTLIGRALHPDGEPRWHELHDG
ncbi:MAG TPA: PilZ domain-containing protein [Acidimicrobiales bacterium]|nr:PilZ domain-containing protein [Acidimicrobiales bacterium]